MSFIPNYVQDVETGEKIIMLPQEWDYNLVVAILQGLSKWDFSISFYNGIEGEGGKYCEEHYNYQEMNRIVTFWDLKGHSYSILQCINPRLTRGEYHGLPLYHVQFLMVEGHYSESDTIRLTRSQKQQLADGWGISLEELIRQSLLLRFKPRETPSCSITKGEECFLDVDFSIPPVSNEEIIIKIGEIIFFHNKEINRLRDEYFNKLHAPEERQYYRDVWGFDPAADRIYKWSGEDEIREENELYRYEMWYPLQNDPALHAVGVEMGALVQVIQQKYNKKITPQVRIVFKRGDKRERVDCVHIVVTSGNEKDISEITQKNIGLPPAVLSSPAHLSIPEHFVALKSYVAGIAEMGIIRLLWGAFTAQSYDTEQLGFGFNPEMQMQVMRALDSIAPSALTAIKRDWLMQLVDSVPSDWFVPRAKLLVQRGLLHFYSEEIPKIFHQDWLEENKTKLEPLFNALREQSEAERMRREDGINPDEDEDGLDDDFDPDEDVDGSDDLDTEDENL